VHSPTPTSGGTFAGSTDTGEVTGEPTGAVGVVGMKKVGAVGDTGAVGLTGEPTGPVIKSEQPKSRLELDEPFLPPPFPPFPFPLLSHDNDE
jgi:hypothetical protein